MSAATQNEIERLRLERDDARQDFELLRRAYFRAYEELSELKAALVEPGEPVPIGPAVSLVKELKEERDSLQRLANNRAEQRDALAAHVERMRDVWQRLHLRSPVHVEVLKAYSHVMRDTPTTSLARRDAEKQAAILHKACNEGWWGSTLRHKAFELEDQAGVARMSTEAHQLERRRQAEEPAP